MDYDGFSLVSPDDIPFKHMVYLYKAHNVYQSHDDECFFDIIEQAKLGNGEFYIWDSGIFYIEYNNDAAHISLLGGESINDWCNSFEQFVKNLMKQKNIKTLTCIGRPSWGRIFKDLKPYGMLFQYNVNN